MIRISALGYKFLNVGGLEIYRPDGSGDYLLLFLRRPTQVNLTGEYQLIPSNTFILFPEGSPQLYRKKDGHFENDFIHFSIENEPSFIENLKIPFNTPISLPDYHEITDMISEIHKEFYDVGEHHEELLSFRMKTLLYKFSDLFAISEKGGNRNMLYRKKLIDIRRKIFNHQYHPEGAESIANELGMSTSYVQHLYKDFFHVSIQQDIIWGRISYASNLLETSDFTISEIADACGYDNVEHFSRQFKKVQGMTPSKFRKGFAENFKRRTQDGEANEN
ncbi:MAG: AraC family transcriptional regulator [Eubacterium sp.]|nr:AraC family transcriptional regulator [Eubacterium sp.]